MTHKTSAHRFCAITGFLFHVVSLKYGKKNDFDVDDVIVGVAQKVPVFFANSKNVITGYTNLESNVCLALSAFIADKAINNSKKKFSQKMMKQAVKQLLMKKYGDSFNIKTFKGEKLDELQWYADYFKINFKVHKVINLNNEDYEDQKWRPALEEYKTYITNEATNEDVKTADLLLYKPSTLHILYVKDIDKLKDFANIWQCPVCKEYFTYETSHTSQKSHIEKCKEKHRIKKLNNVRQLYKEMNKRRGYNYEVTDYLAEYYESFIGYEHLLTEDMDDIINISPCFSQSINVYSIS